MATPGIYTLSLHDALPISRGTLRRQAVPGAGLPRAGEARPRALLRGARGQAPGLAEGVDRAVCGRARPQAALMSDRKSTRLNSSHVSISYAVFCLKKKKKA